MNSLYEIVYGIILENTRAGGWVDMDRLWRTLYGASFAPECVIEAVNALAQQGMLIVWPTGEIYVPKTGLCCPQCGGVVDGLWSRHIDECLRRQRMLKKIKQDEVPRLESDG
jgi:hypothetical protein